MASATILAAREDSVQDSVSETITPFNMDKIRELRHLTKPIVPNDMGVKFAHLKSNVSVLFKPAATYPYFEDGSDLQENFLGTINKQVVIAAREWVYTVNDVVIRSVKDTFIRSDKVDSIYGHVGNKVFSLLVFIRVSKYDDCLAEQLATYEIELEDRFAWATFEFHYVPIALGHDSVITKQDTCYFKRNYYE